MLNFFRVRQLTLFRGLAVQFHGCLRHKGAGSLDSLRMHQLPDMGSRSQCLPLHLAGLGGAMGCAQTGTGKTAGFTLPLLQHLITRQPHAKGRRPVRALILTPTRELAAQIGENVRDYSKYLNIRSLVVFGGVSINPQMMKLRGGVDVLVATPGRLLDRNIRMQ